VLDIYINKYRWEKQQESRFRLVAFPTTEKFEIRNIENGEKMLFLQTI